MAKAKVICVFGSASDVGKSATATALCRIFANKGLKVAPYKAQNMSNNAGVVHRSGSEGGVGEMGRAQVIQAIAARVDPETDMNPVLLKPSSDRSSQVVLNGLVLGDVAARDLWKKGGAKQSPLREAAFTSLRRLIDTYDVVVLEGAGSCGEVNLRDRDFVNFHAAHEAERYGADVSVVLVCDIEKGGVFAQVVGTCAVVPPQDRALIRGIVINKFRGDVSLFDDGRTWLEAEVSIPVLGVIPHFDPLDIKGDGSRCILDSEDGLHPASRVDPSLLSHNAAQLNVAVILLPRIANLTDFSPLQAHPAVQLDWLRTPRDLGAYSVVIIPGSKSVTRDFKWVEHTGWTQHIIDYTQRAQGTLLGICGGYQMLGGAIHDTEGHDGEASEEATRTLGLLPTETHMLGDKVLRKVAATWTADAVLPAGTPLTGYEIHTGRTTHTGVDAPYALNKSDSSMDGCSVAVHNGAAIVGTYLHGLFEGEAANRFVEFIWQKDNRAAPPPTAQGSTADAYDVLAEHFLSALPEERKALLLSFGGLQ